MKLKTIMKSAIIFTFGFSGLAFAADYIPPERLTCTVSENGVLSCADFNRAYLTESLFSADIPRGKEMVYNFLRGVAFESGSNEWAVFYTYINTNHKTIKIKTFNTAIKPNTVLGSWKQSRDIYTCTTGYRTCPITNLPSF